MSIQYIMFAALTATPTNRVYWASLNVPDPTGEFSGYPAGALILPATVDYSVQLPIVGQGNVVPFGLAGGDLSNLYPNPTVSGLQNVPIASTTPTTGQLLEFDGTEWVPVDSGADFIASGDLSGNNAEQTVIGLQGNPIKPGSLTGIEDGYVLTWNIITNQWEPAPSSGGGGGGTLSGDVVGPEDDNIVVKLYTNPIASTAPVSLAVPIYDTSLSHYDIRPMTLNDIGPAFSITGFSGGSTVEAGVTVTNPAFTVSYSSPATSAQISNTDGINSPIALSAPYTSGTVAGSFHHMNISSVTFTVSASKGAINANASTAITYLARSFGGIGTAGASGIVTASGNNAVLSTGDTINNLGLLASDTGQVFGPFNPTNQVIYLLLLGGSHTFKDNSNGFPFAFNSPTMVSFVNQHGASIGMYLYQTTNTLTGTFSILVFS